MRRKEVTIPTILGLLVAVGGLVAGLWLLSGQLRQRLFAAAGEEPRNIKISNIGDTSFTVTWITDIAAAGFVQYGEAGQSPDLVVSDERDQQKGTIDPYKTHFVVVRGLKAGTTYSFRVGSGKNLYDKQGTLYETTTGVTLGAPPTADVAYGQIVTETGEPADGSLVYLTIPGMAEQVGLVKSSGSWVVPLSTARSADLKSYGKYDAATGQTNLFIQSPDATTTQLTVPLASHTPVAQITLGQSAVQSTPVITNTTNNSTAPASRFSNETLAPVTEAGELMLLTPKFGEGVNTARPEIIGNAPAGTEVTIEVHSEAVVNGKVVADSNGEFSFSVPTDLPAGQHTVTISALINGAVRRVTRSFTVYAAGESNLPYYSATPSATLAPSPSAGPTARLSPTVRPSATPRLSPTPTIFGATPSGTVRPTTPPRVVVPATDSALPVAGYDAPTIALVGLGLFFMIMGGWWYRRIV